MQILPRQIRETGRDYALRVLKDNIIHLELAPGSMVSENELAAQLGLSRTPVREALLELSKVKIVEIYPQRGSAIALVDYVLVEEARFMRNVLECAVAELACERADSARLQELAANVDLQEHYLAIGMVEKLWPLDNEFHHMLFRIASKEQTYEMLNSFTVHFDRVRSMSLAAVKDIKTVGDHKAILEAVARRDAAAAKQVMNKHLNRYKVDEQPLREKFPGFFKQDGRQPLQGSAALCRERLR